MAEKNKTALLVNMTREQREIIRIAAARDGKASSVWLLELGLKAAKNAK